MPDVRQELVRIAHWQAARFGLSGRLVDPRTGEVVGATEAMEALLADVRDALDEAGDYDVVARLVRETLRRGNGAARQRAAFERRGAIEDVVAYVVAQTESGLA